MSRGSLGSRCFLPREPRNITIFQNFIFFHKLDRHTFRVISEVNLQHLYLKMIFCLYFASLMQHPFWWKFILSIHILFLQTLFVVNHSSMLPLMGGYLEGTGGRPPPKFEVGCIRPPNTLRSSVCRMCVKA